MDIDIDCPSPKFSCGSDLATLSVASDLAHLSWLKVSNLQTTLGSDRSTSPSSVSVEFEQSDLGKFRVLAFATSLTADFLHQNGDSICSQNTVDLEFLSCKENPHMSIRAAAASLVSSGNIADFQFMCSKQNPHFSVNAAAISLFLSVRDRLSDLKHQIVTDVKPKPFIITGHGLGGSIAALFTLWVLDSLNTVTTKRPLCITFGSPLIGDLGFQEALSQYSTWSSCFLHVVHKDDPFPTLFNQELNKLNLPSKKKVQLHSPFGTYLFCSDYGSTCFESSGSVAQVLEKMSNPPNGVLSGFDYGSVVDCLRGKVFCRDNAKPDWRSSDDSFKIGVKAQLAAIGFQQLPKNIANKIAEAESDAIIDKMEAIDSTKKLNEVKMRMAQLGWYKKETARDDIGYYDSYKNMRATRDNDVVLFKKTLDIYWEKTLEEAENKPQKVAAHLRKRWLYSGTLYRRMVEPLHIADFYKVKGHRDYIGQGRPKYLRKLEELNGLEKVKPSDRAERRHTMIGSQMTDDSCFWAHVEEAILSCESIRKGGNTDRDKKALEGFEEYAYGLIKNYGVSSEIFLKESTFMKWWKVYDQILKDNLMGVDHDSKLIRFMKDPKNRKGKDGMYTPFDDDDDDLECE